MERNIFFIPPHSFFCGFAELTAVGWSTPTPMSTGRYQASSRRSGLVFAVTDENRTVDIGENILPHVLGIDRRNHGLVLNTDDQRRPVQDDQGVPATLSSCPSHRFLHAVQFRLA